jgi:hypothetical protein
MLDRKHVWLLTLDNHPAWDRQEIIKSNVLALELHLTTGVGGSNVPCFRSCDGCSSLCCQRAVTAPCHPRTKVLGDYPQVV